MKVGIMGLLREGIEVTHYTNKEIWKWVFENEDNQQVLGVTTANAKPKKAKCEYIRIEAIRRARMNSKKDTTVIIENVEEGDIVFASYLFLVRPAPDRIFKTERGSILLADEYKGKLFVKGILVDERDSENPPALYFGVDFSDVAVTRDRKNVMSDSKTAKTLSRMWDSLISGGNADATSKYLKVLLEKEECFEAMQAEHWISLSSAEILFKQLVKESPDRSFFYCADAKDAEEV
jgi:hypothetical protein